MIKIGLTGGIGSGKTTIAHLFLELGIPVYFADLEAKRLMHQSRVIRNKLIAAFGKEAFIKNKLNRKYIANIVFNDKEKLKVINAIVHPSVSNSFKRWVKKQKAAYVIQENAILFENDTAHKFDYIITVTASQEEKVNRVVVRDNSSKGEVLARMRNQLDDAIKIKQSHFVIDNHNIDNAKKQVLKIHQQLLKKAQ